ncbi:MAG TPA: sugar transferase [Anaerolineae bacterium]|nr:sugar transferase [Anaerolineae bacterium]
MQANAIGFKVRTGPVPLPRRVRWLVPRAAWIEKSRVIRAKRVIDLALCFALLPLALPLMALVALLIYFDSAAPILFVQERAGKGGRKFRIYKFRTLCKEYSDLTDRERMKAFVRGIDTREIGSTDKLIHKPFAQTQMTRVGKFLRKTSLDELPQLWNVLRGEMSFVGPRPNVLWEVEAYSSWHTERLEVLPGITGLAQVRGRSGIPFDQIARYDIEYIRSLSLTLDAQILWWTVLSIVQGKGAG